MSNFTPPNEFGTLKAELPLALFPVRLQVRFANLSMVNALPGSTDLSLPELWIRIYPDDIFVQTHEHKLNKEEVTAAQEYWDSLWERRNDSEEDRLRWKEGALQSLIDFFGTARARWIIRQTTPEAVDTSGFPTTEPELPNIDNPSEEAWNEAPRTYLLPDRFIARLESDSETKHHLGKLIQKQADGSLIVGIDPNRGDEFSGTDGALRTPEEIQWMVDFPSAVEIGMGLRVPLTEEEWETGFNRLYVVGLQTQSDETTASTLLESLFENHRYKVGGMDLIPPGMPTNNTRELTVPQGPDDRSAEEALLLDKEADDNDSQRLAEAFGLPEKVFGGLDHSQLCSVQDGLDIHRILFDATLGRALAFYEEHLPEGSSTKTLTFMSELVSGRGLLPALRIDDQPYSILPALPYSIFKSNPDLLASPDVLTLDQEDAEFIQSLWTNMLHPVDNWFSQQIEQNKVPHLDRKLDELEVQKTFLSILQLHPTSIDYRQRFAFSTDFFELEESDLPEELAELTEKEIETAQIDNIKNSLDAFGFSIPDTLRALYFDKKVYAIGGQNEDTLVGLESNVIPPLNGTEKTYLDFLAEEGSSPEEVSTILYRLLSYRLNNPKPGETLADIQNDIEKLANMPASDLHLLVREHLDCCTYRLDAWIAGLAGKRLAKLRAANASGINIGAWGYLENLRPQDSDNSKGEFIPAPSLRHATTAAVLRSGYQANKLSGEEGLFATNLSSNRIKDALFLTEGVRNGQDLSALLGYRLERAMREHQDGTLARLIEDLRIKYPFKVEVVLNTGAEDNAEVEEDYSQRVIDALSLLKKFNSDIGVDWNVEIGATAEEAQVLDSLLNSLDEQLDSVKDLLAAESVYQLVDGQMDRAKAALDALTEGEGLIIPEVVNTPRSSLPLTFRMGVIFPRFLSAAPGNPSLRSIINNPLNRWLFDRLPSLSNIRVWVRWQVGVDDKGVPEYRRESILLRNSGIQPIDLVIMMHLQREKPEASELRYRIESLVRNRFDLPLTERIEILEDDSTDFDSDEYTLLAIEPLAAGIGKMILETRSLKPEDFLQANSEERSQAGQLWDPRRLRDNLGQVALDMEDHAESFEGLLANIQTALDSNEILDDTQIRRSLESLRESMFYYAKLGWVEAVPTHVEALDRLSLEQNFHLANNIFEQANNRMKEAILKLSNSTNESLSSLIKALPTDKDPQQVVETLEEIVALLYGPFYKVFPEFRFPNSNLLETSMNSSDLQDSKADFAVDRWIQTQAMVRPNMDMYYRNAMLSELFGSLREYKGFEPMQLPIQEGETGPWVGQEYGDFQPHPDTLAMVLELQDDFKFSDINFSGLHIDDWQELVPDPIANTGIALQYDQPDMEAPNAVLLALTHQDGMNWDWENLITTISDTVQMAKKRGVDPDLLKESPLDQFLPGLLGPLLTEDEAASLNFGLGLENLVEDPEELSDVDVTGIDFQNIVLGNIITPGNTSDAG